MVAGLAAKLQEHPDDPEGWSRLGRSYTVLGEPDKAVDAYRHAVALKPDDAALKAALDEAEAAARATRSK
jgi:cytochrome c-type biogenesis protein CcmH